MSTKSDVSFLQTVQVANPAAGQEFTLKSPGQGLWRVISLTFTFTTSAAVANRRVGLIGDDQTDVYFAGSSSVDLTAGVGTRVCAFSGAVATGALGGVVTIALPQGGAILQPGHRLRSSTLNLDVADAYTAIRALVQEYPYGPDFEWLPTVPVQVAEME